VNELIRMSGSGPSTSSSFGFSLADRVQGLERMPCPWLLPRYAKCCEQLMKPRKPGVEPDVDKNALRVDFHNVVIHLRADHAGPEGGRRARAHGRGCMGEEEP